MKRSGEFQISGRRVHALNFKIYLAISILHYSAFTALQILVFARSLFPSLPLPLPFPLLPLSPSPEELMAMILTKAQETASAFAEQPITGAVITVPAFFSQAERRAVEIACDLAGIKLLQLMTDNTAVALNYGVFR